MRPIRKETAAAHWLLHLVRVVAGTGGSGDAVEDASSRPEDIGLRPALRPCAAPLLHRASAEARIAHWPTPVVLVAWIEGDGLGQRLSTPIAAVGR